jgi:hypothetical protein
VENDCLVGGIQAQSLLHSGLGEVGKVLVIGGQSVRAICAFTSLVAAEYLSGWIVCACASNDIEARHPALDLFGSPCAERIH